jgi:glutamine amidotransferase
MKIVGVVDYKAGNLKSVENALLHIGANFKVTDKPDELRGFDALVFPGVGEAAAAMRVLSETGLGSAITEFFHTGKPLLGICLGSQIVLSKSEEGNATCLGLVRGRTVRFPVFEHLKVPHMGWNQVHPTTSHPVFESIPDGSSFYFVHSYYPQPDDPACVAAKTEYGMEFASAIAFQNLIATQFHPEKSGEVGLTLLRNFIRWEP